MSIEIYTSAYNLSNIGLDWTSALYYFCKFADRVTIAFNGVDGLREVKDWQYSWAPAKLKIVETNFSYDDPYFDGKIKDAALQATTEDLLVLLDLDERIPVKMRKRWDWMGEWLLLNPNFDGCLIASVNLCGSIYTAKDVGRKWYLHKRGLKRGVPEFAKIPGGKIDITKSDTTELLKMDNTLANCAGISNDIEELRMGKTPYVFHLWAVDAEQRIRQNRFWKPTWENRAGKEVNDIILDVDEIKRIPVFEHELELW